MKFPIPPASCWLAVLVGVFYLVIALVIGASPDLLLSLLDWTSRSGFYTSITINLVVALALLWAAPSSRWPPVFNFIGGFALLEMVFYLMMPIESWAELFDFWMVEQRTFSRIASILLGLPLGAFIIFSAIPESDES